MFFVAYTLDGQEAAKRPLTFAFNGGPGSASVWLHMGALGPKRVVLQPNGFMPAAPYRLEDNPDTLLDRSDIVMVDAMATGYSRAANAELTKKFLGVKGDVQGFGEFIRLYISRYERWSSPLFLLGRVTVRRAPPGIAGYLADHGIAFNGVTLLSMAVDFQTLEWNKSNDMPYFLLVPTFNMIAGYHHKLSADLTQDVAKTREEVVRWSTNDYALAMGKGDALTPEEHRKIVEQLSRYIGLRPEVIEAHDLRIDVPTFMKELLLDQKLVTGRLDGRFSSPSPGGDERFYDPTGSAILPPYTSAFNNYLRTELNYKSDMPYRVFAYDLPGFRRVGLGQCRARLSQHGGRVAVGYDQESVYESSGDGGLLRPGHAFRRCQLDHGSPEPGRAVPPEYFVRHLQRRTHGVHRSRRTQQDEKRSGRLHGEVPAEMSTGLRCEVSGLRDPYAHRLRICSNAERMRAAVIFGLGTSPADLKPFQAGSESSGWRDCPSLPATPMPF